jgi:translation initiation factor 2 alpha subunit (eIF-2alpha)
VYLNPITVDGITYNFTEESLKELIKSEIYLKSRIESVRTETTESYRKLASARSAVYDFFTEAFDGATDEDETTVTRDEVNELLEAIGSDILSTTWSATVEITVTVTGIKATSPEEVEDIITDNIEVSGYDLELHDPDVRVQEIERE